MALLLGLESFINQYGSLSEYHTEPFDLIKKIKNKINTSTQSNSIVLMGESGSGKTLFLIKLMKELQNDELFVSSS